MGNAIAQNDAIMQAFYWNVPFDEASKNGYWWDNLNNKADELKNAGITGIWVPAPSKGNWGIWDMGYGVYDHYDLGNYYQKGTLETRFGSKTELQNMINKMHNTTGGQPKIEVYADAVLNHIYGSPEQNLEANPAVKEYVFDEAVRFGTQYAAFTTNEIYWVVPNAAPGSYWIKIKGYRVDDNANYTERAYECAIDYAGSGFNGGVSWEQEPNDGGGSSNDFGSSGSTKRGFLQWGGDVDEYKVTLNSTKDIVIKLSSARQENNQWHGGDQMRGYYPVEIWHNGQNIALTKLEARTMTNMNYVTHTNGEPNYSWNYSHFHPVDENDFLTDWNWFGTDAIIPNTKGFGNDFNTFDPVVQDRLKDWGYWMADDIGFDGFRLDFVRGIQTEFVADWIDNLPLLEGNQRFIVGEYWGVDYRIKDWVNDLSDKGVNATAFDFPLKGMLTDMCNKNSDFDMSKLNNAGMIRNSENAVDAANIVTWLDNHDTGKEHDKWVTKDWKLGYSYILTHQGKPCVFYPHYYGVTLVDNHDPNNKVHVSANLKSDINKLLFARKTYLGGGLEVLTETGNPWPGDATYDVYVARRDGNDSKQGAIVVINDSYEKKGVWVSANAAGFPTWENTQLKNAFTGETTSVYDDGRVYVEAPARGYAVYVLESDYVGYVEPKSSKPINEKLEYNFELSVYPNPGTSNTIVEFTNATEGIVNIQLYDAAGRVAANLFEGRLEEGVHQYELSPYNLQKGSYFLRVMAEGKVTTKHLAIVE